MTNEWIWQTALRQSAIDCNCSPKDFLKEESIVTRSVRNPMARKYLTLPFACDLVSYGNNIVAEKRPQHVQIRQKILRHETDLQPVGEQQIIQNMLRPLFCHYELRILHREDFRDLYLPQWSDALCKERQEQDVLAIGAYDTGTLVGLAGCSADCEEMYQIGINVLPEYRRQGIAGALTSRLALEILKMGKIPFYCAAWCNLKSVRNAIKCGFRPAWTEVTAREIPFVENMNRR